MEGSRVRAWWSHRQGLDGSLRGKAPGEALEHAGWSRSVGGAGPYLTVFSRTGTSRAAIDESLNRLDIHELPSARGCTYVLPARDFALGLRVGQEFGEAQMKVASKLGVTDQEVDTLCEAVLKVLAGGAMDPEQIRDATGSASRNLGEEGKKRGVTTTLPLALGRLQGRGEIRRVPAKGRLDQQRYRYTRWTPNPLEGFSLSPEEAYVELARRFFRWTGPATLGEFQWFSGLGVKTGKSAAEPLHLVPLEEGSDRLMFEDDRQALMDFQVPSEPQYALVSSLDPISANRRDLRNMLDEALWKHPLLVGSGLAGSQLADLPNHAVLDRGRLAGLWEYEPDEKSIVWMTFGNESDALKETIGETERFIRDELGDARTHSLDSPKGRKPRIAALRAAARVQA